MTSKRLEWIDGIKGLSVILVVFLHYLLAFRIYGYVGWNCVPEESEKFAYYFEYFPYSILTNGSFVLYIFFAMIAFLPALSYFKNDNSISGIKKQAAVRYFRLMPGVLFVCLLSVVFLKLGLYKNMEVGVLLNNPWLKEVVPQDMTFINAIYKGLIGAFTKGTQYVAVLWCMHYIFIGSFLSYAVITVFGSMKKRAYIYSVLAVFLVHTPAYLSFLAGIVVADIMAHSEKKSDWQGIIFIMVGVAVGNFPMVLLPSFISIDILYGIGSFFVLWGCIKSDFVTKLLEAKWLQKIGKYSFSLLLSHMFVLLSASCSIYLALDKTGVSPMLNFAIVIITAVPLNWAATILFDKCFTKPTNKLCGWIGQKLL